MNKLCSRCDLSRYGMGAQASILAFTSLTAGQLLRAITARSETHSVFDVTPRPANTYLSAALPGSFGLQALTIMVPGLRSLLGLTNTANFRHRRVCDGEEHA